MTFLILLRRSVRQRRASDARHREQQRQRHDRRRADVGHCRPSGRRGIRPRRDRRCGRERRATAPGPSMPPCSPGSDSRETAEVSAGLLKPMPSAIVPQTTNSTGTLCAAGTSSKPSAIVKSAAGTTRRSPTMRHDAPDEDAVDRREHHANEGEDIADRLGGEAKAPLGEQRKRRLEARKRRRNEEEHQQAAAAGPDAVARAAARSKRLIAHACPASHAAIRAAGRAPRQSCTKHSAAAHHIGAEWPNRVRTPPIAGPKMKPSPKAAPTRPMPFARFSRRRDVGDVRLRGRDVAAGDAAKDARGEDQAPANRRAPARRRRRTTRAGRRESPAAGRCDPTSARRAARRGTASARTPCSSSPIVNALAPNDSA